MLSKHFEGSSHSFKIESKIKKAFNSTTRSKEDKEEILRKIALKYSLEEEEEPVSDGDSEYSSDLYMVTEEDFNLLEDDMILGKEKNYFGKKAKDKFWNLYKSDRTFKDNAKSEIKDPRFAYIKTCHDLKVLPKAGMMIRSEKTSHLSFANQGLLQKSSKAVAESLKRYSLEIEALDFTGNGIRAPE